MDSRMGHFSTAVCASNSHKLTQEGSLGEEIAQVKAQSCQKDEGTSQAWAKGAHHTGPGRAARSGQAWSARTKFSDLQLLWAHDSPSSMGQE